MTPDPGYTTTEWWTTLATNVIALIAILHPGFKAPPGLAQALAALGAFVGTAVYSLSRAQVKAAASTATTTPTTSTASKDATAAAALRQLAATLDPSA